MRCHAGSTATAPASQGAREPAGQKRHRRVVLRQPQRPRKAPALPRPGPPGPPFKSQHRHD